jgi:hypothetical protein
MESGSTYLTIQGLEGYARATKPAIHASQITEVPSDIIIGSYACIEELFFIDSGRCKHDVDHNISSPVAREFRGKAIKNSKFLRIDSVHFAFASVGGQERLLDFNRHRP